MKSLKILVMILALTGAVAVASPLAAQQEGPARGGPEARFATPLADTSLALKIETPKGHYFVELGGEIDGPVRIPVSTGNSIEAIEVSTRLSRRGQVSVALSSVEHELFILPVGSYDLDRRATRPLELPELAAYGLPGWRMSIVAQAETGPCCKCGGLSCCPNPGQCVECSSCAECCLDPF